MAAVESLEKSLGDAFKGAPKLPVKGREMLVQWLPWINLVLGLFTLWSVYWLWHWAHIANGLVDYVNQLSQTYGIQTSSSLHKLDAGVWLGIIFLAVEAVLYLLAFQPTKNRKKSGWNLMFYALLVNLAYGIVIIFTNYGGLGNFLGYLLGTLIGLYFLFQIRPAYK
jgi:hypothetical protein